VAGHQPPQMSSPMEPPTGTLQPPAPRSPPVGPLQPSAPREPHAGMPTAMLRPSAVDPHHSKPHERPPVGVGRPKCPANKNNNKIYQIKQ
jgi:hypothetical protein